MTTFPPSDRTRLRRKPQRAHYDEASVFAVLDAGVLCHIAYAIDGQPFVTPTAYWREGRRLFWHGSAASRMITTHAKGVQVCVTVSHLDGLVLGRSGFTHSVLYRSVMAFGRTEAVTDRKAKRQAMHAFIDRLYPGRSGELRQLHDAELDAITVIAMTIDEAAAKIREGGVIEKDEDSGFPAWAGVIPVRTVVGAPVPDMGLVVAATPPRALAAFSEGKRLDEVLTRSIGATR
jgi:nitroimidazol reductase NimA-like FMN-containing flavoprotein (pyridoxamine 5'-phosphate oxidase superfamily)